MVKLLNEQGVEYEDNLPWDHETHFEDLQFCKQFRKVAGKNSHRPEMRNMLLHIVRKAIHEEGFDETVPLKYFTQRKVCWNASNKLMLTAPFVKVMAKDADYWDEDRWCNLEIVDGKQVQGESIPILVRNIMKNHRDAYCRKVKKDPAYAARRSHSTTPPGKSTPPHLKYESSDTTKPPPPTSSTKKPILSPPSSTSKKTSTPSDEVANLKSMLAQLQQQLAEAKSASVETSTPPNQPKASKAKRQLKLRMLARANSTAVLSPLYIAGVYILPVFSFFFK